MGVMNYRKYARVEVEIPVAILFPGIQALPGTYINNLSEEGASLISEAEIPVATTMEFDIALPKFTEPTHVRADILWSRPVNENGENVFAHGIIFNRIDVEDRERLHAFVENAMSY
ncbi:PilZ domain-containing protein [bacterium]|nr:PilZ domain-containing protein [bacterium]